MTKHECDDGDKEHDKEDKNMDAGENKNQNNMSKNILYDLSVLAEWKLDSEPFVRGSKEKQNTSIIGRVTSTTRRSAWTVLRSIGMPTRMPTPCLLPEQLVRLKSSQSPWHVAVSSSGSLVAVLQTNSLEIRSFQDGLDTVYGTATFSPDPYPQWRCAVWSEDEVVLACSRSDGSVDIFDILGSLLFTIPGAPYDGTTPLDLSNAVAALILIDVKPKEEHWSHELLVINHHGTLSSYFLDREKGSQLRYTFVLASQYPRGVSSACFCPLSKMLLVGGSGLSDSRFSSSQARLEGISAWRLLSDAPFCKLITDYEEDVYQTKLKASVLSKLKVSSIMQWNSVNVDGVFCLSLSPNKTILVSLHFSGKLCIWNVPSLRLVRSFALESQAGWNEISPYLLENATKRKRIKDLVPHMQLLDVQFWSEDRLIVARCTGAVSVVSAEDLSNLLGKSPEWFEPSPCITPAHNGGFLGLECEVQFPKKRFQLMNSDGEVDEGDESDEEDISLMSRTSQVTKQVLYYLTDSERFQSPKRKPRYVSKVYRLVLLKSTTPEELYARKIDAEEYGEALALAQAYNLDCDLVYQRQWRKAEVSLASIQDYLNKISKRAWILHECLERVPDNIDAMRELLMYGLNGTDLPALVAIGKGEDGGRFMLSDPEDGMYEDIYDAFDPRAQQLKEEKKASIQRSLLEQVDFNNLNLEQKEVCRARLKFLQYLDRLKTYEHILGGPSAAAGRYTPTFFTTFRSRNIFELAAEYAQNCDWQALEILMTFHSKDLAPHRLAILSNCPETADPLEYANLLPEINEEEQVIPWEPDCWREDDWAEASICRFAVDLGSEDEALFLYVDFDHKYRTAQLSKELTEEWYLFRACQIEVKSRLVDHAIQFTRTAIQKGAENLSELLDDLLVMELMVYECGVNESLTLTKLREMADYDRLEFIMSKSSEEMFPKNLRRWMVPFLENCERKEPLAYSRLLQDFVLTKSRQDLTQVLHIFEASKPSVSSPVIKTPAELMSLALDSLYTCERNDQLHLAERIYKCLPVRSHDSGKESPEIIRLHQQVDQLEQHISAAKIFQAYGINQTLASIRTSENNPEEAKSLMVKLTRLASKRSVPLSELEWHKLHDHVTSLQSQLYRCVPASVCQEIFVQSLLCSGRQETILLAGQLLERNNPGTKASVQARSGLGKVAYPRAVDLVLSAASEYFDSSANLNDSCMELARSCLNLILDTPPLIQAELDLIASLALLDEFNVAVLPLQVRLSKDRQELVKKAVTAKPNSYKQTQRLLRLSQLLGLTGQDQSERDGVVLQMCAEAAVSASDYDYALQCCERLMNLCHAPAWSVCLKLAEQDGFHDLPAKSKLLSFALTYCSNDMIQTILQTKYILETQILYEQISKSMDENSQRNSPSRESQFSAQAALKQTQQILSSTKRTTSAVLSTMTDSKWWQSAISSLKNSESSKKADPIKQEDNSGFKKQGCHPFYSGIIENCYEDKEAADYWNLTECKVCSDSTMSSNLLRVATLEEVLTLGQTTQPINDALIDLAKQTITRDTQLGLAYLLVVPTISSVDNLLQEFPTTEMSLQVAVYYYALRIYNTMQPNTTAQVYALYRQSPSRVVGRVLDYVASSSPKEWSEEVQELVENMMRHQEMLEDLVQASTLQNLGKGIDILRFAEDNEYKRETIFGLAMTLDEEVYNMCLSLAKRGGLPLWDVYMSHLEFLFTDSGLTMEELQARVNQLDILPILQQQSSKFSQHMMDNVYLSLLGSDLKTLGYFFSLLEVSQEKLLGGLSASQHSALLKKLRPACPGLDYKKLLDDKTPPLEVIKSCLTAANVNIVAKLAPQIPDKEGGHLRASSIYSCWASLVFWAEDGGQRGVPESQAGWVHRYESIGEWIQKLFPEDLIDLVDSIVFLTKSRTMLNVPCRIEITKRALKFSRQSASSKKKKQEELRSMSWEECSTMLQSRLSHLTSLTNDTVQSLCQASDPVFLSYGETYDMSKGDLDKVELLLVQMILDGQAVELVDDILQIAPASSLTTKKIVQLAVSIIVQALRGQAVRPEIRVRKPWLEVLKMVVVHVQCHEENGGDLVNAEDVMSLLRNFCSDSTMEVLPRLNVLRVVEQSFVLLESDKTLLTLYRTRALVTSIWPESQVTEEEILSNTGRRKLFDSLLDKCSSLDQFLALSQLLNLWPSFSVSAEGADPSSQPWVQMFSAILASQGPQAGSLINRIIKSECPQYPLDLRCTEFIFEALLQHKQPVEAVYLVLQSPHTSLLDHGLDILSTLVEGTKNEDLLQLILSKQLGPRVVSMPVFEHLVSYILDQQGQPDCPEYASAVYVSSQLSQAGAEAAAGTLIYRARSGHPLLQTLNSSMAAVRKWLQ